MIEYDEDGTTMLKIHDVTPSDDGVYKCVAANDAGTTSTSCTLTVIGPKLHSFLYVEKLISRFGKIAKL